MAKGAELAVVQTSAPLACPACDHVENFVLEVRGDRRRRECTRCKHRWTTYEVSAERLEKLERIEEHAAALAQEVGLKA